MNDKPFGTATVESDKDSEKSYIMLKVGPFKDRRAALRKLTALLEFTSAKS